MPSAIVEVNRLRVYARHGVSEQETCVGNDFEVSVKLEYPCMSAMINDNVHFTINYSDVVAIIMKEMSKPSNLLENVVYRIYSKLQSRFPLLISGRISLYKLHPPMKYQMESCGFTYQWNNQE